MSIAATTTTDESDLARRQIAAFMRTLRDNGFAAGLAESRDAAAILASPLARRTELARQALKALCCSGHGDWLKFDQLFDACFLGKGVRQAMRVTAAGQGSKRPTIRSLQQGAAGQGHGAPEASDPPAGASDQEGAGQPGEIRREASAAEALSRRDLAKIADPEELALARSIAAKLARAMRARLTRRHRVRASGRRLDLRRTLHRAVGTGGEPFDLVFRRRRTRPLKLVILLDASGSMELYTPFLVRFMHGALEAFREAEAFLFHTRLVHVADALREKDVARALDRLGLMAEGIGGGTRIGESLADFNTWHAARVIHSRTCVMIVSDGCDTGEPGRLGDEMARLRRRCRRIVWLNPMLGQPGYAPEVRGMREALPFVDLFAPAHSLASLADLEPYLARI